MRSYRGYAAINMRQFNGWRTFHSLQMSVNRRFRDGLSFGLNDTWVLYDHAIAGARLQHAADGSFSFALDQAEGGRDAQRGHPQQAHPQGELRVGPAGPEGRAARRSRRSAWSSTTGSSRACGRRSDGQCAYNVGYSYSSGGGNVNITGSNDFGGRVRIVGDPGSGCSDDMYRQFNAAAFQGPLTDSDGLESPNGYLRGCFQSVLDLSIARNIRMGGAPEPSASRGHVQRAERGGHHRPQHAR